MTPQYGHFTDTAAGRIAPEAQQACARRHCGTRSKVAGVEHERDFFGMLSTHQEFLHNQPEKITTIRRSIVHGPSIRKLKSA
jgi:hypothetical protein